MKTILAKINDVVTEEECITDVGNIISMTNWAGFNMDGGYAEFLTDEIKFMSTAKRNFVLWIGCTDCILKDGNYVYCNDPRVIMMYLWKERRGCFNIPLTDPPIPTREEAIAWLKEMDIPLEPQQRARETTPKMNRNFFNGKG